MDIGFNTPLKAARPGASPFLYSSPQQTPPRGGEQPASPLPQPVPPTFGDRYITDRASHDMSLSSFLLTTKENVTPLLAMCRQSPQREDSVASSVAAGPISPPPVPLFGSREASPMGGGGGSPFSPAARRQTSHARFRRGGSSISPGRAASVASSVSEAFAKLRLDSSSPRRRGAFRGRSASAANDDAACNGVGGDAASADSSALRGVGSGAAMSPMDVEPYTCKLARTLFSDAPQTSVLGGVSMPGAASSSGSFPAATAAGPSEQDRFQSSLGVVYENNRTRNFTTKSFRVIAQTPERILDAANMVDDFYLNLVHWSSRDVVAVALRNVVYLWHAATCHITQLPQAQPTHGSSGGAEPFASGLNWSPDGQHLAVGSSDGSVHVWDVETQTVVRHWRQHTARVGSLSWTCGGGILATGSKDATVRIHDLRDRQPLVSALRAHQGEVCGLKWSPGRMHLASGGNDNQLLIWDRRMLHSETDTGGGSAEERGSPGSISAGSASVLGLYGARCARPVLYLNQHVAAVKALAWNPIQPTLLVSGGGTEDKTLRFWNTLTGECTHMVDTQSQVCGVLWSHSGTELVSSHGFSQNQLTIWKYPSLRPVAHLTGHTSRVLHLCMSPDGEVVVSAAGDETIRFWRCFPPSPNAQKKATTESANASSLSGSPASLMKGGSGSRRWGAVSGSASPTASSPTAHHDPILLSDSLALR